MASGVYNNAKSEFILGNIPWELATIKVMLVGPEYVFDPDDDFISQIVAHEVSGTGYTGGFGGSGRKTLASKTVTINDSLDRAVIDADDVLWTSLNVGTVAAAVIVKENTFDGDSLLISYMDFNDLITNGGDFSLVWSTSGIAYVF